MKQLIRYTTDCRGFLFLLLVLTTPVLRADQDLKLVDDLGAAHITVPVVWNVANEDEDDGRAISISALQSGNDSTFHFVMLNRERFPQTAKGFLESDLKQQEALISEFKSIDSSKMDVGGLGFNVEQCEGKGTTDLKLPIHVFVATAEDDDHVYLIRGKFRGYSVEGYKEVFLNAVKSFVRS